MSQITIEPKEVKAGKQAAKPAVGPRVPAQPLTSANPKTPAKRIAAEEGEISFLRKWRWPLALAALGIAGWITYIVSNGEPVAKKAAPSIKTVTIQATPPTPLPPPPPPPPPPPKIQQPQEPKMIEQTPVNEPEPKPEESKPNDDPPAPLGTNIQGDGPPDGFGLSGGRGAGGGTGKGLGTGGKPSSRWGWYAAKVQASVGETLRRHPRTREAVISQKVRIWPDSSGRIFRAKLVDSTGDASLDSAITEALTGIQLSEPPPADMPSPILLRLSARRP